VPITDEEAATRNNYRTANNINYKDGDYESTIQTDWNNATKEEMKNSTKTMYQYAKTTLISDKSRVVKGGSWKDGPYWLSPGTRRYLDEDKAASWVGFRCAMDRMGSAVQGKK
jgi:hypothetical protein